MRSHWVDQERAAFCCVTENGHSQAESMWLGVGQLVDAPPLSSSPMAHAPKIAPLLSRMLTLPQDSIRPAFAKDHVPHFPGLGDALHIARLENIHHLVGDPQSLLVQGCVPRQIVDELMDRIKVPHQAPRLHTRDDQVGRIESVVPVLIGRVHAILTEHLVTASLDVEMTNTSLAHIVGDDKLHTTVTVETSSQAVIGIAMGIKDHGLAGTVELELNALLIGPRSGNVDGHFEPVIRP